MGGDFNFYLLSDAVLCNTVQGFRQSDCRFCDLLNFVMENILRKAGIHRNGTIFRKGVKLLAHEYIIQRDEFLRGENYRTWQIEWLYLHRLDQMVDIISLYDASNGRRRARLRGAGMDVMRQIDIGHAGCLCQLKKWVSTRYLARSLLSENL